MLAAMLAFTDLREFVDGRIVVNRTDRGLEFRIEILGTHG